MPLSFAWYLCPYDAIPFEGTFVRRPRIAQYIPVVPNPDGSNWDEAEILGNSVVVKVLAPAATHSTIQADTNFRTIPSGLTVPTGAQATLSAFLKSLGYTLQEITNTNWNVLAILTLLTTVISAIRVNATKDGVQVLPDRLPAPKTVAQIEMRLPG